MNSQPDRIVFATERPLLIPGVRELLRRAGLPEEMSVVTPAALSSVLAAEETSLVILDAVPDLCWTGVAEARAKAPASRFVIVSQAITPHLMHFVLETGIHGVLSTRLRAEEAAPRAGSSLSGRLPDSVTAESLPG